MTVASPTGVGVGHRRSGWLGAAITSAVVAVGTAAAMWTIPSVPTPTNIAKAFVEARFTGDFEGAWELLCGETRSVLGSYSSFAKQAARTNQTNSLPFEVDVAVREVQFQPTVPLEVDVGVVVTSEERDDDWHIPGRMRLIGQGDQFRVCDNGIWVR